MSIGALVLVTRLFLSALQKSHADFGDFLQNHLAKMTAALDSLTQAVSAMQQSDAARDQAVQAAQAAENLKRKLAR